MSGAERDARPRVLLTTVCRPFGGPGEGDSVGAELFHAQITRAQGLFSLRQVIRCWGLDYIAENVEAPCTVLHYPSERELARELRERRYDYVGINFVVATFHKVRAMVPRIRALAPGARIILGGYGTVLPDSELAPFGDLICREEGIGFMRRVLGEPEDRALRHPYAPIPSPRVYSHRLPTRVAHVTAGLGCPNGCDFCCTSHFFKRKYIPFARTGRELYETIRRMERDAERAGEALAGFIVIDEDFFSQPGRAREFLACVRRGGRPLSLMGFGSARGLSRFTADEIAEMGFDTIWTAVEGEEAGYAKLEGKPLEELHASLKARGVALLTSMIIGFPYQDRARVMAEFERMLALGPSMSQILIYFAFPGTPLHRQVLAEGRYLPAFRDNPDLRRFDGFAMHFEHPHFSPTELEALQRDLYRQEFERLGPSLVRILRIWLEGYRNLKGSNRPLLKGRAEQMRAYVRGSLPGLYPAILLGPGAARRREARQLLDAACRELGPLTLVERLEGLAAVVLAAWTWCALELGIFQQPRLLRLEHRMPAAASAVERRAIDRIRPLFRFLGGRCESIRYGVRRERPS